MKRIYLTSLSLFSLGMIMSLPIQAEQNQGFKPPQSGAPKTSVGGGTRMIDSEEEESATTRGIPRAILAPDKPVTPVKPAETTPAETVQPPKETAEEPVNSEEKTAPVKPKKESKKNKQKTHQ